MMGVLFSFLTWCISDPYAPKTEKQIPFYKGFILVMRHGPYLTLTAAFLFITVAIQVNADLLASCSVFQYMEAVVDPDTQCWSHQSRRALTESVFSLLGLSRAIPVQRSQAVVTRSPTSVRFDTFGFGCFNYLHAFQLLCVKSLTACFRPRISEEASVVTHVRPAVGINHCRTLSAAESRAAVLSRQDETRPTIWMFHLWFLQLVQSNFVLFCTYAADLRDHFQNIVLTILVSGAFMPSSLKIDHII